MEWKFFGGDTALDLINTVIQADSGALDTWASDADVMDWLRQSGNLHSDVDGVPEGLLAAARRLRETVRALVRARKGGEALQVDALNAFLAQAGRHLVLSVGEGAPRLEARYAAHTIEGLLGPAAEAAAQLLAQDFALVKHCESPECSLWFVDTTKSHRRRWCSMAICGNRHKVAQFRQKRAQT